MCLTKGSESASPRLALLGTGLFGAGERVVTRDGDTCKNPDDGIHFCNFPGSLVQRSVVPNFGARTGLPAFRQVTVAVLRACRRSRRSPCEWCRCSMTLARVSSLYPYGCFRARQKIVRTPARVDSHRDAPAGGSAFCDRVCACARFADCRALPAGSSSFTFFFDYPHCGGSGVDRLSTRW